MTSYMQANKIKRPVLLSCFAIYFNYTCNKESRLLYVGYFRIQFCIFENQITFEIVHLQVYTQTDIKVISTTNLFHHDSHYFTYS